jgi:hypothetical protein
VTEEETTLLSKYRLENGSIYGVRGKLDGVKMSNGYLATRVWIGKEIARPKDLQKEYTVTQSPDMR